MYMLTKVSPSSVVCILTAQIGDDDISPKDPQSSSAMNLKSYGPLSFRYFVVSNVHHLFTVEPSSHSAAYYANFHGVPITIIQELIFLGIGLDQPSSSIGFIDTAGVAAWRSYFYLPARHFSAFKGGPDKDPAVAILFLLELCCQFEILVVVLGTQITIFSIRTAFRDNHPIFHIPFLCSVNFPTGQILTVEQYSLFGSRTATQDKGCRKNRKGS